ncbi:Peptidase M13 N-terminal domain [Trinorchestia longiramus]|nr:Peptidase M13 N-terminal domain [Trinorchestia longiramus]
MALKICVSGQNITYEGSLRRPTVTSTDQPNVYQLIDLNTFSPRQLEVTFPDTQEVEAGDKDLKNESRTHLLFTVAGLHNRSLPQHTDYDSNNILHNSRVPLLQAGSNTSSDLYNSSSLQEDGSRYEGSELQNPDSRPNLIHSSDLGCISCHDEQQSNEPRGRRRAPAISTHTPRSPSSTALPVIGGSPGLQNVMNSRLRNYQTRSSFKMKKRSNIVTGTFSLSSHSSSTKHSLPSPHGDKFKENFLSSVSHVESSHENSTAFVSPQSYDEHSLKTEEPPRSLQSHSGFLLGTTLKLPSYRLPAKRSTRDIYAELTTPNVYDQAAQTSSEIGVSSLLSRTGSTLSRSKVSGAHPASAVLQLHQHTNKLIGYSEDPFLVSSALIGNAMRVPVVNEYSALSHIHQPQELLRRKTQRDASGTQAHESKNLQIAHQLKFLHLTPFSRKDELSGNQTKKGTISLKIKDKVEQVISNHGYEMSGGVVSPISHNNGGVESKAKQISTQDSLNLTDEEITLPNKTGISEAKIGGASYLSKHNNFSHMNMNYSLHDQDHDTQREFVRHLGMTYIRKNFLIMPIYRSIDYGGDKFSDEKHSNLSSIDAAGLSNYTSSTTEASLLNARLPIYQEIANSLHIDSSIDDTVNVDEVIPAALEDDNEKFLPDTNSSAVNMLESSLMETKQALERPEDSGSDGLLTKTFGSENVDQNGMDFTGHQLRHHSFVLKQKVELMSSLMDDSVDPCHDFYQYACGGWSRRFTQRPDQAVDNTFERLRDDLDSVLVSLLQEPSHPQEPPSTSAAKTLYQGCMNVGAIEAAGTAPLLQLLTQLGGWPVLLGDSWDPLPFNLSLQMARLRQLNNEVLLAESVADDVTNSSRRIVQLDQPKLGLPGRNYYLSNSDLKYRQAYLDLMLRSCHLLGADPLIAMRDMADVLFFETELAKILVPAEERRNLSAIHRRYSRQKLKAEFPGISWDLYLDTIAPDHSEYTQQVRLFCHNYLRDLSQLLNTTSPRTINNYLLWRLVKNRLGNLGSEALSVKQDYIKILFGRSTQPPRWRSCITYVNGNLGGVVGSLFVKRYFPEESRTDTEEMISLIRQAFGKRVNEADWMLPETRQTASDKVSSIVWNVGYPEDLLNDTYMNEKFANLQFSRDSHFSNVLRMLRYHWQQTHAQLGTPVSRTAWSASPATVNAYYSRTKNMIMFPAGILQPPFYHPAYPRALNYGGIGVVIGHEISHGFDDGGRQFDKMGNLKQWWTKKDVLAFYARATCMLEQYGQFEVPELEMHVNAITTLGENIADNAGLNIAYTAYRKWLDHHEDSRITQFLNFTANQLFFLNFGQIWCEVNTPEAALTNLRSGRHSPNKFRVVGTLSNSEAFSQAFECKKGSPMNPVNKCSVW